jgi:hypothetical protein
MLQCTPDGSINSWTLAIVGLIVESLVGLAMVDGLANCPSLIVRRVLESQAKPTMANVYHSSWLCQLSQYMIK